MLVNMRRCLFGCLESVFLTIMDQPQLSGELQAIFHIGVIGSQLSFYSVVKRPHFRDFRD